MNRISRPESVKIGGKLTPAFSSGCHRFETCTTYLKLNIVAKNAGIGLARDRFFIGFRGSGNLIYKALPDEVLATTYTSLQSF